MASRLGRWLKLPVNTAPDRCQNPSGVGSSTWMLDTTRMAARGTRAATCVSVGCGRVMGDGRTRTVRATPQWRRIVEPRPAKPRRVHTDRTPPPPRTATRRVWRRRRPRTVAPHPPPPRAPHVWTPVKKWRKQGNTARGQAKIVQAIPSASCQTHTRATERGWSNARVVWKPPRPSSLR